jgi:hypothetical protein
MPAILAANRNFQEVPMRMQLTHTAIGLLLGTLAATSALAAEVPATGLPAQERPQPMLWDRLDKRALERHTQARKQPAAALPADIVEPARERPADRK